MQITINCDMVLRDNIHLSLQIGLGADAPSPDITGFGWFFKRTGICGAEIQIIVSIRIQMKINQTKIFNY